MLKPRLIFVFSGKRKSGKDFVTAKLKQHIGDDYCEIMQLSGPLKKQYADDHELDYGRLMDSSEYKERVRKDMIQWGEEQREKDPGVFCKLATVNSPGANKPIWIISDARRKTDVDYFKSTYPEATNLVRVIATIPVREERGFKFTPNVDDAASECDLDTGVEFDYQVRNDGNTEILDRDLNQLVETAKSKLL